MNGGIRMLVAGVVLLALSPVALAQRASLAERVAVLEQQAAANRGNTDLLRQVTLLKEEVQALRAQVEELQHAQEQAREAGRNQYLDIDSRLIRQEGGTPPPAAPAAPAGASAPAPVAPNAAAGAGADGPSPTPVKVGDAERAAYEAAFEVLKAGQYDASARQFSDFLQQFPDGALDISGVDPRVSRVLDIKTPGSGEVARNLWSNLALLTAHDQVKFVICSREDFDWAAAVVAEHRLHERCEVLFSPSFGEIAPRDLADWIVAEKPPVRFQLQLHKLLWNDEPGR
jgi:hypothetical protein